MLAPLALCDKLLKLHKLVFSSLELSCNGKGCTSSAGRALGCWFHRGGTRQFNAFGPDNASNENTDGVSVICRVPPASAPAPTLDLTVERKVKPVYRVHTAVHTGFTFLSTVKCTKFSRPGYPGVLNLVPLGTKFSTAQSRKNSKAG